MQLIILHKNEKGLLRFATSSEPMARIILDELSKNLQLNSNRRVVFAIPEKWSNIQARRGNSKFPHQRRGALGSSFLASRSTAQIEFYDKDIILSHELLRLMKRKSWFAILNGRFVTQTDAGLIEKVVACAQADVVSVNVRGDLLPYSEKARLTTHGKLAGFRRLYSNCAEWATLPVDWPHYLFVKTSVINQILADCTLPLDFSKFINICLSNQLAIRSINVGGNVLDLDTEKGLSDFIAIKLAHLRLWRGPSKILNGNNIKISDGARLFGKILFGQNISIDQDAIIVGPTIIGNNVKIAKRAVVRSSIIGSDISIPANSIIQGSIISRDHKLTLHISHYEQQITNSEQSTINSKPQFRTWPRLSYARCFKRIADIAVSTIVLILFAPIFPVIALVIKLTSRGPVLFKDTRQGLHGKTFNCLKFRTMLVGADKIQDKLRVLNQADGPQFRIPDDPRVSCVGKFLRDTYIDEIPQFLNVLLGQMSVVGPRPSPESENTLCPPWRDARLSVRPGITGLWQVCRTRQPMKDFQEWIYYDIKYVRNLSLKLDLWICWQTAKKMVKNFINQF